MENKKYIIGNGLAGLLAAYYFKDYFLIGKKENAGGQFNSNIPLGPKFIKYNKYLIKLLKKLKIRYTITTTKCSYLIDKNIYKNELSREEKDFYNKKINRKHSIEGSINNDKTSFKTIDFEVHELIEKLNVEIKDRIIDSFVNEINIKNKVILLDTKEKIKYDKVISTINYIDFCKLANYKCDVKCGDIYFYIVDTTIDGYFDLLRNIMEKDKTDFMYCLRYPQDINRITRFKNFFICESNKEIDKNIFYHENMIKLSNVKLLDNYKIKSFKNILFLGRYAELNQNIRVDNVIDKIIQIKNRQNIKPKGI